MAANLYGLNATQFRRLQGALATIDAVFGGGSSSSLERVFSETLAKFTRPPSIEESQTVRVSSGTPNGDGTYSGFWVSNDEGDQSDEEAVRILQISGQALDEDMYYRAYFSHQDETSGYGVFIVPDSVTGGGSTTLTRDTTNDPTEYTSPITDSTMYCFKNTGITTGEYGSSPGVRGPMLLPASQTQAGTVDLGTQQFLGDKQVVGFFSITNDASYDWGGSGWSGVGNYYQFGGTQGLYYKESAGGGTRQGVHFSKLVGYQNSGTYSTYGVCSFQIGSEWHNLTDATLKTSYMLFQLVDDIPTFQFWGGFNDSRLMVDGGKGITTTFSGTPSSITIKGGIITAIS